MIYLRSDNIEGVSPPIMEAVSAVMTGSDDPYGDDAVTARLASTFGKVFACPTLVAPVGSGIVANALGLSLLVAPTESVICHELAHARTSEAGAYEMFTHGAALMPVAGANAKITAEALAAHLATVDFKRSATLPPVAVTLTQGTERGTIYMPDEIAAITEVARRYKLRVHMDGARFANAVAALGCHPADITWKAGVDVLSFGATKNGAMSAEALILFDRNLAASLDRRRRRGGQLVSKMRFQSAQLLAYLADDLWLANARHANAAARRLGDALGALPGFRLLFPVEINLVFLRVAPHTLAELKKAGVEFRVHEADRGEGPTVRLVTSFATSAEVVDEVIQACTQASKAAGG